MHQTVAAVVQQCTHTSLWVCLQGTVQKQHSKDPSRNSSVSTVWTLPFQDKHMRAILIGNIQSMHVCSYHWPVCIYPESMVGIAYTSIRVNKGCMQLSCRHKAYHSAGLHAVVLEANMQKVTRLDHVNVIVLTCTAEHCCCGAQALK